MRRKLAILLAVVLVMASLAGCSRAELGYLDMSRQLQAAEEYRTTGSITGEIDFEVLASLMDKTMKKVGENGPYSPEYIGDAKEELSEMGLVGTQKVTIHYDMLVNMKNSMAFQADFDVTFNGKTYKMGDMYFDGAGGVFLSKDLLIGIFDLYKDFTPNKWDSYFYSKEYRDELLKALGSNPYVSMDYLGGMGPEISAQMDATKMMNQELNDAAIKFIETAFSGFTTGAVSAVSGGYKISLDGAQMKKLILDGLQYGMDNTGKMMIAYRDFTAIVIDKMPDLSDEERAEAKAEIDSIFGQNSQIMISSYLAMARQAFVESDKAGYLDFMRGFGYEATVKKAGDKFVSQSDLSLKDGGKTAFSVKSQSEVTIEPVEINLPKAATSLEDVERAADILENKHNPVKEASLSWWNGSEYLQTMVAYERAKVSPFGSGKSEMAPYLLKESRLYVPMRSISEGFGEQVTWDQKAKKAYVVRDGKQIEMTGIIQDGRTYIKVVDFEKLGYKVSYEYDKEWKEHTARISR